MEQQWAGERGEGRRREIRRRFEAAGSTLNGDDKGTFVNAAYANNINAQGLSQCIIVEHHPSRSGRLLVCSRYRDETHVARQVA